MGRDVHLIAGRPADKSISSTEVDGSVHMHWIDESATTGRWLTAGSFQMKLNALVGEATGDVIIHDHGLWLSSNHGVARFAAANHAPRVVSPRGMLSAWAMRNGRLKKQVCWWIRQRADLLKASAFHATSETEATDIRSAGLTQPIAIIPNGIAFPEPPQRQADCGSRRMLFLSRIHPVKGVLNLVNAFHHVCSSNDWELMLVGPGENGYREEVRTLVHRLGLASRVSILDSASDREKWRLYSAADLFVLPSFSENFGIVIAEALASGVPVITTTATPWSGLVERNAGWWVEPTVDAVAGAMTQAISLSQEARHEMGRRGSQWVRSEFRWDMVAKRMNEFYQWLNHEGLKPEFVV